MARVTPPPLHVANAIKKFLIFLKTFSTGLAGIQLQSLNKGPADNVQVDYPSLHFSFNQSFNIGFSEKL